MCIRPSQRVTPSYMHANDHFCALRRAHSLSLSLSVRVRDMAFYLHPTSTTLLSEFQLPAKGYDAMWWKKQRRHTNAKMCWHEHEQMRSQKVIIIHICISPRYDGDAQASRQCPKIRFVVCPPCTPHGNECRMSVHVCVKVEHTK